MAKHMVHVIEYAFVVSNDSTVHTQPNSPFDWMNDGRGEHNTVKHRYNARGQRIVHSRGKRV